MLVTAKSEVPVLSKYCSLDLCQ